MEKVLMVATVPSMIGQFNMNNIAVLQELGYQVQVACNFTDRSVWTEERITIFESQLRKLDVKYVQIDFPRSPTNVKKLMRSYRQLRNLIVKEEYVGIHCHTPVAGMLTRMVARKMNSKVIYTAHGFHFYQGAPIKNWLLFYPVEKFCAKMTDVLITINLEDYKLAKKKLKAKAIEYVPGVGVDVSRFCSKQREKNIREAFVIPDDALVLLSVGELNANKNHESVIRAISQLSSMQQDKLYYLIVGQGVLDERLHDLIENLHLEKHILLTGFRQDVTDFYKSADLFVFPSYREGLSVALMEAMACELPIVASDIRGNRDLIDQSGGVLFVPSSIDSIKGALQYFFSIDKEKMKEMGTYNKDKVQGFDVGIVEKQMNRIYAETFTCARR